MRLISLILTFILVFSTPIYGAETTTQYGQQLEEAMALILEKYLDNKEVNKDQLFKAAMTGMFNELDVYSTYIGAAGAEAFSNRLDNSYVGIGVVIGQEGTYVVIDRVFTDSPADQAGLKVHDKFVEAEGIDLVGKTPEEVANIILGKKGTKVALKIDRQGYIFSITLIRDQITINPVEVVSLEEVGLAIPEEIKNQIGYLRLESFTEKADESFNQLIQTYKEEGKQYLLLDLRDNGGGYVDTGVNICRQIIPKGPVLKFVNNKGEETFYYSDLEEAPFKIVALVNRNSASATEFVAAAIKESGVGVLVGETTYGKGVAQRIYSLKDGSIIKLTEEAFYSGKGKKVHKIGVAPDIEISVPEYLQVQVKYHLGDQYESVKKVEEILTFLGYDTGIIDDSYDEKTMLAVKKFQTDQHLYAYGICDFTTQKALNQAVITAQKKKDIQLIKGLEQIMDWIKEKKS